MNYYGRLVLATISGVVLIALLTAAIYWGRSALDSAGYAISDRIFFVTLSTVLGGGFGLVSKFILGLAKTDKGSRGAPQKP